MKINSLHILWIPYWDKYATTESSIFFLSLLEFKMKIVLKKYAVIVAGGKGKRMHANIPKQFLCIDGSPILMHTISAFYKCDKSINLILVLPKNQFEYWISLCEKHNFQIPYTLVQGGETRFHSVKNGLSKVHGDSLVAIHDGVRPFVNNETINRCFELAKDKGCAIPVVESVDSLRFIDQDKNISVDRNKYKLVQTPQVFKAELLQKAYEQDFSEQFTDDASVYEANGEKIYLTDGNRENIKITTSFDLSIAEAIINQGK